MKRRVPIKNLILRTLAVGGVFTVALIAPNMTKLLKSLDRPTKNREALYRRISQGVSRLEREGLVNVTGEYAKKRITLTKKGKAKIAEIEVRGYTIAEPAFWDGKWRVLIFDIKEKRRQVRDQLRHLLQSAGFLRIQDSVWIHPFPCDEFISLLRAHLRSGVGEMRMFVAEALESDRPLREYYNLL